MVKKPNTTKLLGKITLRTIFKEWLQFLAIILINAVAVTLFVGLCSNADNIKKRTDILYEGGNVGDLWTSVTTSDEQDLNAINTIVSSDIGYTETRYSLNAEIGSGSYTALMSKELPTINAAYNSDNVVTDGFFIIDSRLFNDPMHPELWDKWIDENGVYREQTVSFNFASIQGVLKNYTVEKMIKDRDEEYYTQIEDFISSLPGDFGAGIKELWNNLKARNMLDIFGSCLKDESSENIFNSSTIDLTFQVTGSMMFAENVQSSLMNASNFLLDIDMFKAKLRDKAYANYGQPEEVDITDPNYLIGTVIRNTGIIDNVIDMVVDSYTYNTYCTKLYDKSYTSAVKESIQYYFSSKGDNNNLIMCTDIVSLPSNVTIQNDIKQARQLAYIFPVVFFLVAILVVVTTFSQIILKERTQIGTLKAIGISKGRIILHYLVITTIIIGIGAVLGCIIGPFLLSYVMNIKYAILYTLPPMMYVFAVPEALISTGVSILLSGLVTFLVVRKEVVLNPSESMRPASPKSIKTKAMGNAKKPVRIAIKMAFRNIRVNLVKSLMVVVGIMGCTALLVCGFGVDDTLDNGVGHDMRHYYGADISLNYSSIGSHKDEILSIPGVTEIEEAAFLPSTIKGTDSLYDSKVFCIEDDSKFLLGDNGHQVKGDVAITQKEANDLGLKIGDTIEFSVPLVRKEYFTGTIGAIFETFYMHGVFVNSAYNDYSEIMVFQNNAYVNVDNYDNVKEIAEQIKSIDGVLGYKTRDENNETISSYMSSISLMTLAVKGFAIILAVVVLYNLALLNFKERNRDIATMKVLGFNQMEIMLSLIIEIMVLTLVGIGFGMLLGMPLEVIVLMVNRTPVVEFLYTVYPLTYLISFAITFGTGFIVNMFLSLKTRTVKMVESLKSVD